MEIASIVVWQVAEYLSQSVMKALVLAEALMAPAKQPDGSYAYELDGPINGINPVPLPAGK